ncbi:MAG: hypothetical protein Q8R28_22455 [Dehalococcoidia bacterium]|nr:hypothetical protein [Dehalococcoidia bacterium]
MPSLRRIKDPRWWLWILPAGGFMAILIVFYASLAPLKVEQPFHNQPAGEIRGPFSAGQTFYSPYAGLYRIDLLLATYTHSVSGQVNFNLTPGPKDSRKLASVTFDASTIEDNQFRAFEFTAPEDSAGRTYFFYLEAPSAQPDHAITVWTDSNNPYSDGAAYLGGQPVENDLTFIAYFRPSPWQLADMYLGRMAKGKPGLWGSESFYAFLFTAYLAVVAAFLFYIFRWVVSSDKDGP